MKVALDPEPWTAKPAVLATWEDGPWRCFALTGRSDIVRAQVIGGDMELHPDRSSQHRALIGALGLDTP